MRAPRAPRIVCAEAPRISCPPVTRARAAQQPPDAARRPRGGRGPVVRGRRARGTGSVGAHTHGVAAAGFGARDRRGAQAGPGPAGRTARPASSQLPRRARTCPRAGLHGGRKKEGGKLNN